MSLDELQVRQEIHDVVLRYCRGIDRLDLDAVRALRCSAQFQSPPKAPTAAVLVDTPARAAVRYVDC